MRFVVRGYGYFLFCIIITLYDAGADGGTVVGWAEMLANIASLSSASIRRATSQLSSALEYRYQIMALLLSNAELNLRRPTAHGSDRRAKYLSAVRNQDEAYCTHNTYLLEIPA